MTQPNPDPLPITGFTVSRIVYQAGAADAPNSIFWLGELVVQGQGGSAALTDELGTAAAAAAQAFAAKMVEFHPELDPWVVATYTGVLEVGN